MITDPPTDQAEDAASARPSEGAATASPSQAIDSKEPAPEESLKGPARDYLERLLRNIATMLVYANDNGIVLPDELHAKLDQLLASPGVEDYGGRLFGGSRPSSQKKAPKS